MATKASTGLIHIEVAYAASQTEQTVLACQVRGSATVKEAIVDSGMLTRYPSIDLSVQKVGIFSRIVSLDQLVKAGDRIEIYRPLIIDPKAARRVRATKQA